MLRVMNVEKYHQFVDYPAQTLKEEPDTELIFKNKQQKKAVYSRYAAKKSAKKRFECLV